MQDQQNLDVILLTLRAWVMETTGDGPNDTSAWFRRQLYEAFPGFVLWATSRGHVEPVMKKRPSLRLVH